eukprot:TRINITY_DN11503_c0_g1_i1.p2 TRINITY_DN11503_c0_g1~~TRINITY_DN11503_c0_g1_i1.p2  ORF type:complete len:170 (+),score=34.56 TRINITY_DN11503_c0_g1_i1:1732-2241(+)
METNNVHCLPDYDTDSISSHRTGDSSQPRTGLLKSTAKQQDPDQAPPSPEIQSTRSEVSDESSNIPQQSKPERMSRRRRPRAKQVELTMEEAAKFQAIQQQRLSVQKLESMLAKHAKATAAIQQIEQQIQFQQALQQQRTHQIMQSQGQLQALLDRIMHPQATTTEAQS